MQAFALHDSVDSSIHWTPEQQQFLQQHDTIVVGGEMDWPPLDYVENGVYKGVARDYLEEIARLTGLDLKIVTGHSWPELMAMLSRGELDMLPMMYWSEQRAKAFLLSRPYLSVRHYVFSRNGNNQLESLRDLHGKTIAIPKGYAPIEILQTEHPEINLQEVNSELDAIDRVMTGHADAVLINTAGFAYYSQKHNILGLEPAFPVQFAISDLHMAVRKELPLLREVVQRALDSIDNEQAVGIMRRWTGSEIMARTLLTRDAEITQAEREFLESKASLTACLNPKLMPLEALQQGVPKGITSDYLAILSRNLQVPINVHPVSSWPAAETALLSGQCDLATLAPNHSKESRAIRLSPPYLTEKLALITRRSERFFARLSELPPETIGLENGYIDRKTLGKELPFLEFQELENTDQGLQKIRNGEIFGLLTYLPVASYVLQKNNAGSLKISGSLSRSANEFSIATRSSDVALTSAIEKVLAAIPQSKKHDIHNKWIAVTIHRETDYSIVLQIAIALLIILSIVQWRYSELRRHRETIEAKNTELQQINRQLAEQTDAAWKMAYQDQLTGLANRAKLMLELDKAIKLADRNKEQIAVLFLDLDRFKYVNDTLGHHIGDQLLCEVASRIQELLRTTDTLCRMGGDEFIVLLQSFSEYYVPQRVAQRIITRLTEPYLIDTLEIAVGASIGIALYPDDTLDGNTLLKYADSAMYSAKEDDGSSIRYYHTDLSQRSARRMTIENALRNSDINSSFVLVFQPIVDLRAARVIKAEALIRWHHPELGTIPPDEFIGIAEEIGLIPEIGDWVFRQSCRAYQFFAQQGCAIESVAVNVSGRQFLKGNIAERFTSILRQEHLSARHIEIEITEGYMLEQTSEVNLRQLREAGFTVCVDDFGTGYSSLSYIKRLPLDVIKIDRSFVQNLPHDNEDIAISQAILSLCHSLGYQAVAEGIESQEQLEFLATRRCEYAQGYYFSPAVNAEEFPATCRSVNRKLAHYQFPEEAANEPIIDSRPASAQQSR